MADITKCKDEECPFKSTCYRYTASAGQWQSWFAESPRNTQDNTCQMYWGETNETIMQMLQRIVTGKE